MKTKALIASMMLIAIQGLSQPTELRSPFLSVNSGVFITALDKFDKVYDSNLGIVFGVGFGLPLSTRSYLYGKATYFHRNGVPVIYTYSYQNGQLVSVTETKDGTATFTEWILNGGIQYNFFLSQDFTLGINGGVTYTRISEEQRSSTGSIWSTIDGNGVLGFFGGVAIEKNFQESPFSIFLEPQYNYSRRDIVSVVGNYGGLNITAGLRYYLRERRTE